jgi:two-component sensor histidine kinase
MEPEMAPCVCGVNCEVCTNPAAFRDARNLPLRLADGQEVSLTTEEELRLQAENLDLRHLLEQAGVNAAERRTVEQLQTLLLGELHHRIKNILATVLAITSQSLRSAETIEEGGKAIEQRLAALGRAHDLLLQANWKSAHLREILSNAIEPFDTEIPSRFVIQCANIEAAPSAAVPLAMAINELCTNAVKYGALSTPCGQIEITAEADDFRNHFCLRWKEQGGPAVRPPTRRGFGTRLIQQSFVHQLHGAVRLVFESRGVTCEIDVPLASISPLPSIEEAST